jgi:hypothetical protein
MISIATISLGSHATTAVRMVLIGFGPNTPKATSSVISMIA